MSELLFSLKGTAPSFRDTWVHTCRGTCIALEMYPTPLKVMGDLDLGPFLFKHVKLQVQNKDKCI